jgi:hypothetical protein
MHEFTSGGTYLVVEIKVLVRSKRCELLAPTNKTQSATLAKFMHVQHSGNDGNA